MHIRRLGSCAALLSILCSFPVSPLRAQDRDQPAPPAVPADEIMGARAAASEPTLEELLKKIEDLESAQARLRATVAALTATSGAAPPATERATAEQTPPAETPAAEAPEITHALGPLEFRGFSDFDFGRAWFEKLPPGGLNGSPTSFNIGDFDLFANVRISDSWSVLGEMLVTSDFTNEFAVEMDRLLLSYKPNEYFNIGFGKFNTALGYYPNAFHRARYFQTATSRPIMYSDEDNGGLLPVHNIGITSTGKIPSGILGLHWVAEISNGRSATNPEVPIQNFVDESNGKAVTVEVYAKPEHWRGFQAGFSVYHDTMHPADLPAIRQNILTGHIVFIGSKLEFLNEASVICHLPQGTNQSFRSLTGYTQVSYLIRKWRPFGRYDYQNVPASDPVFGQAGRLNGPSVGINRHLSNYLVLKLQYGRLYHRALAPANDLQAQLAFAF